MICMNTYLCIHIDFVLINNAVLTYYIYYYVNFMFCFKFYDQNFCHFSTYIKRILTTDKGTVRMSNAEG